MRLGEASARIRLSDKIEVTDAERVIHIVDTCLRQIAYDAKTGNFDIDKVVTGISKEKRDIVRVIKDAIRDIGGEGRRASIEQVVDAVSSQGILPGIRCGKASICSCATAKRWSQSRGLSS